MNDNTGPSPATPLPAPGGRLWRYGTALTLVGSIAAWMAFKVFDYDVWWHAAIGRYILDNLTVPRVDHFAAAALGRPYHDSQWLFQAMLAAADRLGGMAGAQLLMAAVWALTLLACHRAIARWVPAPLSHILLFLTAMASVERFLPRPEIITFLMIALFYLLLQEGRYVTLGRAAVLAALQIVWANAHGLFVIGPFMVGCCWLASLAHGRRGPGGETPALGRLLAMVLAASLATPHGPAGWRYALRLLGEVGPWAPPAFPRVDELAPTFGAASRSGVAFWFFLVLLALAALTTTGAAARRRVAPARLMIAVGLALLAFTARRNMPLLALAAAPLAAENLRHLLPRRLQAGRALGLAGAAFMLAAAWWPLSGRYYVRMQVPTRFGLGATPSSFPHRLPAFLERIGFRGQVYNSAAAGGFYLYHSYPGRIPLIDGRWEVYDPATLDKIRRAPSDRALFEWMVSAYDVRGLLLQHEAREAWDLLPSLAADTRWRLVYYDYAASFWLRAGEPSGEPFTVAAADVSASAALPGPPAMVDDCLLLNNFLKRIGARELRLRNLERGLAFGEDRDFLLAEKGNALIAMERYPEAEAVLRETLREYPGSAAALGELAFLAYRRGDYREADALLRRQLAIEPDNVEAMANQRAARGAMDRRDDGQAGGPAGGAPPVLPEPRK